MSEPDTSQETMTPENAPGQPASKPRRLRHWSLGAVLASLVLVLVVAAGIVAGVIYSQGRTLQAPSWMRDMAMEQFSTALPDAVVSFDNVILEIEDDWHPRILLERVVITPNDGRPALEFTEAETTLSYRRLLQRQIAPRDIRLSGVFLNARREEAGQVGISFGAPQAGNVQSTELTDLLRQIDDWLTLPQFERLTSVEVNAVTIQFDDLRARRSWTVDGGQMQMRRTDDQLRMSASLALLGGRDYVSSLEFNYESQIGQTAAGFGVNIEDVVSEDIASQSAALAWLDILKAPISGAMRVEIDEAGNIGPLSATLQIAEGVIQPRDSLEGIPFQSARSYMTFDPATNSIQFDELSVQSPWVTARAEGKAHLQDFATGLPNVLIAQMKLTQLEGNPADLFDAPISLDHAQADLRLQLDPFELRIGEMLIEDQGQSLLLDAKLAAAEDDWNVALNAHMDAVDARRVVHWWPENAISKTRKWVDENILAGRLSDINFALRSKPGTRPDIYLDFHFDDAEVRYSKTLPIVTGAKGQAVLNKHRFTVMAQEGLASPGQGGQIDVAGTSFVIPDTRIKPAPAEVHLNTKATVTATLALLDHEPLNFLSKANLPVDLAEGIAEVSGKIDLPLKKKIANSDVVFEIEADLLDVRTSHFVKDKVIAAPKLVARVDNVLLTLQGAGRIGNVPFDAVFSTALARGNDGRSSVTGTVELSERFIDEFNIGLTRDLVSGRSTGDFALAFKKGEPGRFRVTSDTLGLKMGIAALGWSKAADRSAELRVEGVLSKPLAVSNLSLEADGLKAVGAVSLKPEGSLDQVSLAQVEVGDWLEGSVNLVGRRGAAPNVEFVSGRLDMRQAPTRGGESSTGSSGTAISGRLDRVTISEGISLTDLQGNFTTLGGFNGEFTSGVNGVASINGVIVPSNGRSAVRIRSADAGGTLRGAGVFKQAVGGDLEVTLRPVGAEGEYSGQLSARSVRVQDAPAMAELLNAISVIGLLDQLGGEGILFTDVNAEFTLTPDYVQLKQGSAAGPSMGISMDGVYDLRAERLDMQGVISPIYMLNAIGRPVSRRGEGLFGFNYGLRGAPDSPSVTVNPLSVLTPGFLRDIFRRPTRMPEKGGSDEAN